MQKKLYSLLASWYLGILEVSGKKSGREAAEPALQVLYKQRKSNRAHGLGLPSSKKPIVACTTVPVAKAPGCSPEACVRQDPELEQRTEALL